MKISSYPKVYARSLVKTAKSIFAVVKRDAPVEYSESEVFCLKRTLVVLWIVLGLVRLSYFALTTSVFYTPRISGGVIITTPILNIPWIFPFIPDPNPFSIHDLAVAKGNGVLIPYFLFWSLFVSLLFAYKAWSIKNVKAFFGDLLKEAPLVLSGAFSAGKRAVKSAPSAFKSVDASAVKGNPVVLAAIIIAITGIGISSFFHITGQNARREDLKEGEAEKARLKRQEGREIRELQRQKALRTCLGNTTNYRNCM